MISPEAGQFQPEAEPPICRPKEIFAIDENTTDIICCIHGEIASPSLVYAARKQGLDNISCLAGGITGLAFYLKHTVTNSDNILEVCHPQFQLPTFKNKIDQFVAEDTGNYTNFHDYYRDFFRAPNIQNINIISHSQSFAQILHTSDFYHYLRSCFSSVSVYDSYLKIAEKYNISREVLEQAREEFTPKAILISPQR